MREGAVVGEHQGALDVHVEPAHREEPRVGPNEVRHHGAAVGVAACGQIAARLVEEDILLGLGRRQRTAVDGDVIAIGVGDGPGLVDDVAVDGDAPLEDEAISSSP